MNYRNNLRDICLEISKEKKIELTNNKRDLYFKNDDYEILFSDLKNECIFSFENFMIGGYKIRLDGNSRILSIGIINSQLENFLEEIQSNDVNFIKSICSSYNHFDLKDKLVLPEEDIKIKINFNDFEYDDVIKLSK